MAIAVASTYLKTPDDLQIVNITMTSTNAILTIRNGGLGSAAVSAVYINDVDATANATPTLPLGLAPGASATLTVTNAFASGVKYMIILVTSKGAQFPIVMNAP